MDIEDTIAPNSEQLDSVDLVTGPRTFTITRVEIKGGDQPASIHLAEFPRPWRPGKNMRRVLAYCWGPSKNGAYEGRRVTLFRDPDVSFGKDKPGGTRISHLSHIDKPMSVPILVSQGRSGSYSVQPLREAPAPVNPNAEQIDALRAEWVESDDPARKAEILEQVKKLGGGAQ